MASTRETIPGFHQILLASIYVALFCGAVGVIAESQAQLTVAQFCVVLDLDEEDCSRINSVSPGSPYREVRFRFPESRVPFETDVPWSVSSVARQGTSSLRSGYIDHGQTSCLVTEVTLPADTVVSFSLHTSSEGFYDHLSFRPDPPVPVLSRNFSAARNSTLRDWEQLEYRFTRGVSNLVWCYVKNFRVDAGDDSGWLDMLDFRPAELLSAKEQLCLALDMSAAECDLITRVFSDPPQSPWFISTIATAGETSLRSPDVARNRQSCLVLELSLPANSVVSVAGRTSSQGGYDQLRIYANNLQHLDTISAGFNAIERDWRQGSYYLPAAISMLRWCYTKNGRLSHGLDTVWVDNLSFSTSNITQQSRICEALDIVDSQCSLIQSVTYDPPRLPWVVTPATAIAGDTSLRSPEVDYSWQSCVRLELSLPANSVISVAGRIRSEDPYNQLQIYAGEMRLDTISPSSSSTERSWHQQTYYLPARITALSWCHVRHRNQSAGDDSAWIDNLSFSTSNISYRSRICDALDLTDPNCAQIDSIAYNPPESLWLITTETSVAGGTSLRSGGIGRNQFSCLALGLNLSANSMITAAVRINSEGSNDQLQIFADGLLLDAISADSGSDERNWQQQSYYLPADISVLSWCYDKDGSSSLGADSAWVDNLSFSTSNISYQSRICTALDLTDPNCAQIDSISHLTYNYLNQLWQITTETFVSGGSSLRSANVNHYQYSCLVLAVVLPANSVITAASRTSSEGQFDQLQIIADSLRLDTISAMVGQSESDWRQESYFLPSAISRLLWCYVKNSDFNGGSDAVWIDSLSFSTSNIPYKNRICTALDLTSSDCARIQSVAYDPPDRLWIITSATATAGDTSLRSPSTGNHQRSCLILGLSLPANSVISVAGRTSSQGGVDRLQIIADNLLLGTVSARQGETERDWRQENYILPRAISALRWCYAKNYSTIRGFDSAWIDSLSFNISGISDISDISDISYQDRICEALDLSDSHCSMIQSVAYDPPQLLWTITSETSVAGGSSLRSPDTSDNRRSCLVLELSLPANSVISVAGRTSSDGGFDQLQIIADNLHLAAISAMVGQSDRDWRQEDYFLPTAASRLRWCYTKDSHLSSGLDTAWIDNLSFYTSDISYQSRICDALDLADNQCSLIQSVTYHPPQSLWIITSETAVAGGSSLRSGDIGNYQRSCLRLELNLPANSVISVAGRTSSEGAYDQLQIFADWMRLDTISATASSTERSWHQQTYYLPAGISALSWCYVKNSAYSAGDDSAWIDNLSFRTSNISYRSRICDALDLTDPNCAQIDSITYNPPPSLWLITTETSVAGGASLRSGGIENNQSSCLVLGLNLPAHSVISVAGRTSSEGADDQLQIFADRLYLDTISANAGSVERNWQQQSYYLPAGISALSWCYVKNSAYSAGDDSAWIDNLSFNISNISYRSRICDALDLTDPNCAQVNSIRHYTNYKRPNRLWLITTETFFSGDSSLRSAKIDHNQYSCLALDLDLPANSVITAASRFSSVGQFDQLQIIADRLRLDTISANAGSVERDWQLESYYLPAGISALSWCYVKSSDFNEGADAVWIDSLSFSTSNISYQSRICAALDIADSHCALIQSVTYEPSELSLWVITSATAVAGGTSLRSPSTRFRQRNCLALKLPLPANSVISVTARSSSQGGSNSLQFEADRLLLDTVTAAAGETERDWRQESYFLPSAISGLRWCYVKHSDFNEGADAVWIDSISFSTSNISYQSRICAALDLTDSHCSLIQSVTYEPSEMLWVITSATAVAGGTSLRSPSSFNHWPSCLALELTLPANSVISVAGRSSSEGGFHSLQFFADSLLLNTVTAAAGETERDWRQESYFLPSAISRLRWCYVKNNYININGGADAVWIDSLSFSTSNISYQSHICNALDLTDSHCSLIQSVTYEPPERLWVITSATAVAGGTSLRSPNTGNHQRSCLVLGLSLPANSVISVAGRSSSEGGSDRLQFEADSLLLDTVTAAAGETERDWRQESYFLPSAISRLRWCYVKNNYININGGADAVWIDSLSFSTSNISYQSRICAALDLTDSHCSLIRSVAYEPPERLWVITRGTAVAGGTSLRSPNTGDQQRSCLALKLTRPANSMISVAGRSSSEGGSDRLQFEADSLRLNTITAAAGETERDWRQESYLLTRAISVLRWCYVKDRRTRRGFDAAWIDNLDFSTSNISYQSLICAALDLTDSICSMIQSVTYEPPQNLWESSAIEPFTGASALVTPPLDTGQSACLTIEFDNRLPADQILTFYWRTTSRSDQDILRFQAGTQQRQISSNSQWQSEAIELSGVESTVSWCYSLDSAADRQTARGWLDNLMLVIPAVRYSVQIAVDSEALIAAAPLDSFRLQVSVTAQSAQSSAPSDWVLVASGIDNISGADSTYSLVFAADTAQVNVLVTPDNPWLPATVRLALQDRPSVRGVAVASLTYQLPAFRRLAVLEIIVSTAVTETAPGTPIEIAVVASATDNFGRPFDDPAGLTLMVEGTGNVGVTQSNYALNFVSGLAQTTVTVALTRRGVAGSIEMSVVSGNIVTTASVTLNPAPRKLASITLSATDSTLLQTTANTAAAAELILIALDNYGDPIEAGSISLQLSASNDAVVQSSLTVIIGADGTARQTVEILPQNDLDTRVTVQLARGNLEPGVQLLPDGGIQLEVRALRILRRLQLSLADQVSPLQQTDPSLPIRAQVQLIGLDQYNQPIAFPEVQLTATANPSITQVMLNPQQVASTVAAGVLIALEVIFSEIIDTTITITIADSDTTVTMNNLVVRALPDRRAPLRSLKIDDTETEVTQMDLVVALRWLTDAERSTTSLVVNLMATSSSITTAGIDNLQQLFTVDRDRIDVNKDGRADQMDLRILLRYMSGLPDAALSDQQIRMDLIRLLMGQELQAP